MRFLTVGFLLGLILATQTGCNSKTSISRQATPSPAGDVAETADQRHGGGEQKRAPAASSGALQQFSMIDRTQGSGGGGGGRAGADYTDAVSLASISTVYAETEAIGRKIIRNAELTVETDSPEEGLRKITVAAESNGGFVVTSEFKQNPVAAGAKASQTVVVIARVPATRFASALDHIRSAGERVIQERVSGQDVSEEYLDLEARIRTKKALEAQFLEIMKQARKVEDALEVQRELADVRTEIERFEGRRRFLENQAALSTITTTLQMPQPIVAATAGGFSASVKRSFGDAIDTAASIVLFIIQALIVLIPIAILFGLPGWLLWRVFRRRIPLRKPEPSPIPNE